jgi:5'-deoxynucleotidase
MEQFKFYALVSRMRHIQRWGLMRNSFPENIQEHSHMVAVLAHALAMIEREMLGGDVDPDRCAVAALFHDTSEILTGDLPTPIKYDNPDIQDAYKRVEEVACLKLLSMLPEPLRPGYEHLIFDDDDAVRPYVKAADKLSAHIKCLEELKTGNREFESAAKQTRQALENMHMACLDWFLEHCLEPFSYDLDQLE